MVPDFALLNPGYRGAIVIPAKAAKPPRAGTQNHHARDVIAFEATPEKTT